MTQQKYYQKLVTQALFRVIKSVLSQVAERGLKGNQHFYITFNSGHKKLVISEKVKARNPDSITVVIQHQFHDLSCDDDSIHVVLYFDNIAERVRIPYDAIIHFADPSANFALNFENPAKKTQHEPVTKNAQKKNKNSADVIPLSRFQKKKPS